MSELSQDPHALSDDPHALSDDPHALSQDPHALSGGNGEGAARSGQSLLGQRLLGGGTDGNERLTSVTGAVLIVLLAIIGVTILRIGSLLWVHLFVGIVLIGPLGLKMASTGYRFTRYYTGDRVYRRKGPPMPALRMIAPMVVASTLAVMGSGFVLLFAGPAARPTFFPIHKYAFFVWIGFTALHVLGHLSNLPGALRGDYATAVDLPGYRPGRDGRLLALAGVIIAGLVLAILLIPEFAAWVHPHSRLLVHPQGRLPR